MSCGHRITDPTRIAARLKTSHAQAGGSARPGMRFDAWFFDGESRVPSALSANQRAVVATIEGRASRREAAGCFTVSSVGAVGRHEAQVRERRTRAKPIGDHRRSPPHPKLARAYFRSFSCCPQLRIEMGLRHQSFFRTEVMRTESPSFLKTTRSSPARATKVFSTPVILSTFAGSRTLDLTVASVALALILLNGCSDEIMFAAVLLTSTGRLPDPFACRSAVAIVSSKTLGEASGI